MAVSTNPNLGGHVIQLTWHLSDVENYWGFQGYSPFQPPVVSLSVHWLNIAKWGDPFLVYIFAKYTLHFWCDKITQHAQYWWLWMESYQEIKFFVCNLHWRLLFMQSFTRDAVKLVSAKNRHLLVPHSPTWTVADPGFPVGGVDLVGGGLDSRGGCVPKMLYVKTKESAPLGAHSPLRVQILSLDPPMIEGVCSSCIPLLISINLKQIIITKLNR